MVRPLLLGTGLSEKHMGEQATPFKRPPGFGEWAAGRVKGPPDERDVI